MHDHDTCEAAPRSAAGRLWRLACRSIGGRLSRYPSARIDAPATSAPTDPGLLMACLRPGDVLLVEGRTRVGLAIQYPTQSTWSHAALFVGAATGLVDAEGHPRGFVEADMQQGVRAVGVDEFVGLHCRICRPVGLSRAEIDTLIGYAVARVGNRYDPANVIDTARYLIPTPPVPVRWRRRMIAFGSGGPTRAICSTLIAQAFQAVRCPILPIAEALPGGDPHRLAGSPREAAIAA